MGYEALKEEAEKRNKRLKRIALCVLLFVVVGLTVFSCFYPPESWKYYFRLPDVEKRKDGELRIHFLDVGQGDCTIVELPDGKVLLIDGGNDDGATKKKIMRYLNALGVDEIDYLLITHADGDHCGSLEEVFRYKKVLNAYLPSSFESSDVEYAEAYEAAVKEGCTLVSSSRSITLTGPSSAPYTLAFLWPYAEGKEGENEEEMKEKYGDNWDSAVVWLDYKGVSTLFCGDAPKEVEESLLIEAKSGLFDGRGVALSETEIVKISHHGSADASSLEFLRYLHVQTAVISCGRGNAYGHPTNAVLRNLAAVNAQTYRTDERGNIVITVKADGSYETTCIPS